jgi:hypothetical protein
LLVGETSRRRGSGAFLVEVAFADVRQALQPLEGAALALERDVEQGALGLGGALQDVEPFDFGPDPAAVLFRVVGPEHDEVAGVGEVLFELGLPLAAGLQRVAIPEAGQLGVAGLDVLIQPLRPRAVLAGVEMKSSYL